MNKAILLGALCAFSIAGAVQAGTPSIEPGPSRGGSSLGAPAGVSTDLGRLIYLGAQTVVDRAGVIDRSKQILVSTMVSIDDFNESSTFGRLASQLIANRLSQRGYLVRDVTYMGALAVQPGTGELVLSRDATRLTRALDAQAIIAGTYAVAGREIFLNIRLLRADDGAIISSADVVVPLDHNTEALVVANQR